MGADSGQMIVCAVRFSLQRPLPVMNDLKIKLFSSNIWGTSHVNVFVKINILGMIGTSKKYSVSIVLHEDWC